MSDGVGTYVELKQIRQALEELVKEFKKINETLAAKPAKSHDAEEYFKTMKQKLRE